MVRDCSAIGIDGWNGHCFACRKAAGKQPVEPGERRLRRAVRARALREREVVGSFPVIAGLGKQADALAVGRGKQEARSGWAARFRETMKARKAEKATKG